VAAAIHTGVLWFAIYVCAALVVLRAPSRRSPAVVVAGLAPVGYVAALGWTLVTGGTLLFWAFSATYAFLTLAFLVAFSAVYKSVTLRILGDLLAQPDGADIVDAILSRYVMAESFRSRVAVLTGQGFADRTAGGLRLSARGRRLARAVRAVQSAWKIEQSG
jgi:hypothetical protein